MRKRNPETLEFQIQSIISRPVHIQLISKEEIVFTFVARKSITLTLQQIEVLKELFNCKYVEIDFIIPTSRDFPLITIICTNKKREKLSRYV